MKALNFSMAATLILGLFLAALLPGCGGGDEAAVEQKRVEKVEKTLENLDKEAKELVTRLKAGKISDEEFVEKISAIEAGIKRLTKEKRDKHWEEQRRLMREQTKGYE